MIKEELAVLDLRPADLALRLGVSRSALYALFEPEGGISAAVQRIRLEESLKVLLASKPRRGLVTEVAARHGFKSKAHFSRSFRARFARLPSDVSATSQQVVGGGTFADWLGRQRLDPSFDVLKAWLDGTPVDKDQENE